MIRKFQENDINSIMHIWLNTNIETHYFIDSKYWVNHYDMVKEMISHAEIYVYENDVTKHVDGFIGLTDDYIEGIFVKESVQSKGIGKKLLDFVKNMKLSLRLNVYQKNTRAIFFYQREQFLIQSENMDYDTNEKEFIMTWN